MGFRTFIVRSSLLLGLVLILWLRATAGAAAEDYQRFWPQWRGPEGTGVAPLAQPPLNWSEQQNIRWKALLPGKGHSTPIIWGNQVFVTTAVPLDEGATGESEADDSGQRRPRGVAATPQRSLLYSFDREDGRILWQRTVHEGMPAGSTHPDGSWAPHSPVTDGEHLIVYFGSSGLYGYDLEGNLIWSKDLGDQRPRLGFGEGNSPALHGNTVIVNWDHEDQSFIVALDKRDGREIWRQQREEITSWSTPLIVESAGRHQVVVNATQKVRSYDLASGRLIWESAGMTVNTIPSPVAGDGIVYLMSGFRGNALQAIRLASAQGDIQQSDAVVWSYDRDTPYVPSPLLYSPYLYFLKSNNAILANLDAATGNEYFARQRVEGIQGVYASPVGASDRVYLAGRDGNTVVIRKGPTYEVLARNTLDDGFEASPAMVDDELYLRGRHTLYCIAAP